MVERREQRARSERVGLTTYLMLAGAAVGWGVSAPAVKFSVEDLAPLTAACLRFGLGSLLLLTVLWVGGAVRKLPRLRDWPLLFGLGALGVAVFGAFYTAGLQWTGAAEGTLIQGTSPLVTMILAAVLLGERLRRGQIVGVAFSFVGLVLLVLAGPAVWGGGSLRLLGDAMMIGSAISWGSYSVAVRLAMGRFSLVETSAWSVFCGALLLLPLALLETSRTPLAEVRPLTWAAISYQMVVSSCLSYLGWNEGVRRIGPGRAAVFGYLGPLSATISSAVLLGEVLAAGQLVGGGLILGGLYLANRRSQQAGVRSQDSGNDHQPES